MRSAKVLALLIACLATTALACVYLAPGATTRFFIDAERWHAGLTRKEVVIGGGIHMVYLEGGQGEPLVLLHGFSDDKDNFVFVSRELVHHFHVIIPDINGFGESTRPQGGHYGIDAQVSRLREMVKALGLGAVHLGGSSMGGQIAMVYAASHPDEVSSLWLLDAGGMATAPQSDMSRMEAERKAHPPANKREAFDQEADMAMSDPPFIPKPMMDYIGAQRDLNKATEAQVAHDLAQETGVESRIKGLATPTLIVWGAQDHMINPATAALIHQLMPNSRVIMMQGAGHLPMLEQPEQSAADYLQFRATLTAAK
ncbi:MAG: alpha/beta hydrolase [Burkholderiales bacterium]|nr:alpha/beta hydrolase [Burkholderiales bacterium]